MTDFSAWIGRREEAEDYIAPWRAAALGAALDLGMPEPRPADALPPGWHWLFCLPVVPTAELGEDGHETRGRFLPPVALPRRMWAGGRLDFESPLRIGDTVRRVSTIHDIVEKQGRSGTLVFVTVRHEYSSDGRICVREQQDIVYTGKRATGHDSTVRPAPPRPAPGGAEVRNTITPTSSLLFRYSALTYNAHKIHLDRDYARAVEGYDGLVVHGPLIATLLLQLAREHVSDRAIAAFSFRSVGPLFDTEPFTVNAKQSGSDALELWAADANNNLATEAQIRIRS